MLNTNFEERYNQIMEAQRIFSESVAPLAERFHRFLLTHQPYDVPMVPVFNVGERKKGYYSEPVDFTDFELVFKEEPDKFSHRGDPAGVQYRFEDWDEEIDASQFFLVPFEYLDDPNAWETRALMPKSKKTF